MSKDDLNSVTDDVREKWMIVLVKSMIKYEAGCAKSLPPTMHLFWSVFCNCNSNEETPVSSMHFSDIFQKEKKFFVTQREKKNIKQLIELSTIFFSATAISWKLSFFSFNGLVLKLLWKKRNAHISCLLRKIAIKLSRRKSELRASFFFFATLLYTFSQETRCVVLFFVQQTKQIQQQRSHFFLRHYYHFWTQYHYLLLRLSVVIMEGST